MRECLNADEFMVEKSFLFYFFFNEACLLKGNFVLYMFHHFHAHNFSSQNKSLFNYGLRLNLRLSLCGLANVSEHTDLCCLFTSSLFVDRCLNSF